MSKWIEYIQLAAEGLGKYIGQYKLLAPVIAVVIYAFVCGRKITREREKTFLEYATVMLGLLLIPVTSAIFLVYQTRFYDYGWVWSLVPLTGILAWGIVTIVYNEFSGKYKVFSGMLMAIIVLFLCGNMGVLRLNDYVDREEKQKQECAAEILMCMEGLEDVKEGLVWGPSEIMQYIRQHDGEVLLFYGRDMWDPKAGAYDYEAYREEDIACYQWMENVSTAHSLYLLEINQPSSQLQICLGDETALFTAVEKGVRLLILPEQITPWVERKIEAAARANGLKKATVFAGEYTLWILEE